MQSTKPKLGYWKIRGLAQTIRYLLEYLKVDFEDVQYECGEAPEFDRTCWTDVKPTLGLDFPNLPYYIDDEVKITETGAIWRYICAKHAPQLLGSTPAQKAHVEMIMGVLSDWKGPMTMGSYRGIEKSELQAIVDAKIPGVVAFLADKEYICGELSIADFFLYEVVQQAEHVTDGAVYSAQPKLAAHAERMKAHCTAPAALPWNNKMAKIGNKV